MKILRQFSTFFAILFGMASVLSAQTVSARFNPEIIGVGEVGTYEVAFENFDLNSLPRVQPPSEPGLKVLGLDPQTSRNTSIFNGRVSSRFSLSWQVAAGKEGTFTVPAQTIMVNGHRAQVPEATLRVVPQADKDASLFRLEWELPDKTHYVGEAIPVLLKLYVRGGIRGNPQNFSLHFDDGLTASEELEPDVVREQVDGVTYNVVRYARILTPIKPDTYDLSASIEMIYEDPSGSRRSTDFFFRSVATVRKLIMAPDRQLEVREIPTAGRPDGFNGAVGVFETKAELETRALRAGEPATLTVTMSGSGNFDRVAAPEIPANDQWRVYPPKVSFSPDDAIGFKGTKTFEYLLIPADEAVVATPAIALTAFDPYREQFLDLSIAPIPVTVAPAPEGSSAVSFTKGPTSAAEAPRPEHWRPFHADLGHLSAGIRPVPLQSIFWIIQGGIACLMGGIWLFKWRRQRLVSDESYARRVTASKTVQKWLKAAETHAAAGEADAFYGAAQRTVQEAVGRHFPRSRKAESLTLSEIEAKLAELGVDTTLKDEVATLFQAGDALRYAGLSQDANALREHQKRLEEILRAIR